ncbi:bestrophin-1-like [Palaemon carinicauda]|uniref:bestrophin-1-like n=1 Tax=Palaemon carinicauda TaxID=392227 RepID=UPI0035B5B54A
MALQETQELEVIIIASERVGEALAYFKTPDEEEELKERKHREEDIRVTFVLFLMVQALPGDDRREEVEVDNDSDDLERYNYMVVVIIVYFYFSSSVVAGQSLNPEKHYEGHTNVFFPVFSLPQLFFFIGWLKVGESFTNPFGSDDDDFEFLSLLERHKEMSVESYSINYSMPRCEPDHSEG